MSNNPFSIDVNVQSMADILGSDGFDGLFSGNTQRHPDQGIDVLQKMLGDLLPSPGPQGNSLLSFLPHHKGNGQGIG